MYIIRLHCIILCMDALLYEEKTTISHTQAYSETPLGFVYVPKTGGTYLSMSVIPSEYEYDPSGSPSKIHMPASKIQSIVKEGTSMFTMLRDPYDRTCSEYYFLKSKADVSIKHFSWDISDSKKLFFMANFVSKITGHKAFFDKIYALYDSNMSVEDYLEWTIDNPTYPIYYDTLTPKDFDIVGVTEDIPKTIELLKLIYNVDAGMGDYNKNDTKKINKPYDTKFSRSEFEYKNSIEYKMYYEGLEKFQELSKSL
jgi:hypothetical protein